MVKQAPTDDEVWATTMLVEFIFEFGGLDRDRRAELSRATRVSIHGSDVEVRFDYLGETSWYGWDGTHQGLDEIVRTAAHSFATTLEMERKAHGPTPWDRDSRG